jgi:hypothetical protein
MIGLSIEMVLIAKNPLHYVIYIINTIAAGIIIYYWIKSLMDGFVMLKLKNGCLEEHSRLLESKNPLLISDSFISDLPETNYLNEFSVKTTGNLR